MHQTNSFVAVLVLPNGHFHSVLASGVLTLVKHSAVLMTRMLFLQGQLPQSVQVSQACDAEPASLNSSFQQVMQWGLSPDPVEHVEPAQQLHKL